MRRTLCTWLQTDKHTNNTVKPLPVDTAPAATTVVVVVVVVLVYLLLLQRLKISHRSQAAASSSWMRC